uniref:dephospho-CoA kinase n=1 Tax=uncultured Erythrobacter sp. TaxID=263913 RepID=UPI002616E145|nr:dephospho-CoA kinase [uncultured Erythrobacter sp.]
MTKPVIIGLTGSIAMGKSTVAAMFEDAGIPVFDADAAVRIMQGPDGELIPAIEEAFPGSTGPEGVNRDALGKLVFGDKEALARLEAIVHPAVGLKRMQFLGENTDAPVILFDIPLLFEGGGNESVDVVVVVSAPAEAQRERVLARPGMTEDKFEHILSLQTPDAEKRSRADFVINTGTPLEETRQQVGAVIKKIAARRV